MRKRSTYLNSLGTSYSSLPFFTVDLSMVGGAMISIRELTGRVPQSVFSKSKTGTVLAAIPELSGSNVV
jgi:hypothetical protein